MYSDIPIWLAAIYVVGGLVALSWSADRFVDGAVAAARRLGISPFIIGMVIIGFGTCAPEFVVSLMSGSSGHASLSLGNAYGSCVFNIAGVLGVSAMVCPLVVKPSLAFMGAPLTAAVAALSILFIKDGVLSFRDSLILLAIFFIVMPLYCAYDQKQNGSGAADSPQDAAADDAAKPQPSVWRMIFDLVAGLGVMVAASHYLVWGSVVGARALGVSELVIGLTIVAIGTSLPELATAVVSAKKGESEMALGNIVGSNLFNMLCVVGTAGAFAGGVTDFSRYVITRDLPILVLVSLSVIAFGANWRNRKANGVISRLEGAIWVLGFSIYMAVMVWQEALSIRP